MGRLGYGSFFNSTNAKDGDFSSSKGAMANSYELPPDMGEGFSVERLVIDYSVYYALHEPEEVLCDPPPLLIATHGYGQSCKNFMRMLRLLHHRGFVIVTPQAPNHFYWEREPPTPGFAWFTEFESENTLNDIFAYIKRLMLEVSEKRPFDPKKVFLMGFSQGAAMAYRIAGHGIIEPAGVIAFSGELPADVAERLGEIPKFPILIVHGDEDDSVPFKNAQEAADRLKELGFEVDAQFFNGQHLMPVDKLDYMARWIGTLSQGS